MYSIIVRDHHSTVLDPGNVPLLVVRLAKSGVQQAEHRAQSRFNVVLAANR